MFNLFKGRQSTFEPTMTFPYVVPTPDYAHMLSAHPRDSWGDVIMLDDLVTYDGKVLQVVAMSHKGKVVVRKQNVKCGGSWVESKACTIIHRHENKEN